VRADPAAAQIERGPQASGVFAEFEQGPNGYELEGLGEDGKPRATLGGEAGLVAATRRYEAPPTWVVSGPTVAAAEAAAELLDARDLRDHYAIAVQRGRRIPLPVR
jgi:hypothetical protein